jgi:hypothetical protein
MFNEMLIVFFLLFGCNQMSSTYVVQDSSPLYNHWVHSHEDEVKEQNHKVYRPHDYDFPPARGRRAFMIIENGVFIDMPIAPGDGNLQIEENWTLEEDQLIITGKDRKYGYQIISLNKEKLVIRELVSE